jgi:RNA polymerase sigma factor (sigma-70 family)
MSPVTTPSVVRQIGSLFDGGSVVGLSDRQLIERFNRQRDAIGEAAFAALVARHGPMVMHVCRQIVADQHHAEDAFQAVFLVLARRARSIRDPDLLSNWLYGVALRTAKKARGQIAHRRKNEEGDTMTRSGSSGGVAVEPTVPSAEHALLAREQAEVLYSEIERLPGPFRLAVVLCYLEGLTLDEAAQRLRCPAGTVRSRLSRAYDKLRRELTKRGVGMPAAGISAVLASRTASAFVSSALCESTARAAMNFAARRAVAGAISASAVGLAHDVLRSMLFHKLKLTMLSLLFAGAIATGTGYVIRPLNAQASPREGEPLSEPRLNPARTDFALRTSASSVAPRAQSSRELSRAEPRPPEIAQEATKPAPGRMFVFGRVRDTQGNPVPNASVHVYARATAFRVDGPEDRAYPKEIGRAASDDTGRIRVDVPRISPASHDEFGVVALAPGFGAGWVALDADADQPVANITLPPEQIIHGRVFDLLGQPTSNVRVSVTAIRRFSQSGPNPRVDGFEGPAFWWAHPDDLPGWPETAVSDADGRFTVRGVGRGFRAFLTVVDPRFATQAVDTDTDENSQRKPLAVALQPARTITGRVTYADTGGPAVNIRVAIMGFDQLRRGVGGAPIYTTTDRDGKYQSHPRGGAQGTVSAFAPHGEPYLSDSQLVQWPKGAITHSIDLALKRGVLIRGKVTELLSHQPVAGAIVALRFPRTEDAGVPSRPVETSADGSFVLSVRSRKGFIVASGPTSDFVLREFDEGLLNDGQPSGSRIYFHALLACDQRPGEPDHDVGLTLQTCQPIKGQVVGPEGKPLTGAWIYSGITLDPRTPLSQSWNQYYHGVTRNGPFELRGVAPEAEFSVSFLEPQLKLGATIRVSGKTKAGEPIRVTLLPCGAAKARLVGPDGKPLGHFAPRLAIMMVVTPGEFSPIKARKEGKFMPEAGVLNVIDPVNYPAPPASNDDGRLILPALVPGTTYVFVDRTTVGGPPGIQLRKEFTVKPGETLDLGDILIEKPNLQ